MMDTRGGALLGLFALAFFIFGEIGFDHTIANVQLFGVLATAVISGGLGAALGFYFGSSASGAAKDAVIAGVVAKTPDADQ